MIPSTLLSSTSWLRIGLQAVVPSHAQLDELFADKPPTRETLKMYGKTIPMPRFQKLYGSATYAFSGLKLKPQTENIPSLVKECIDYANDNSLFRRFEYNGALVNWYMDHNDSISPHSDDETDLEPGAPIFSFSFGAERIFELKAIDSTDVLVTEIRIPTRSGSVIIMGGDTQKQYRHGIPKSKTPVGQRINITVRALRSNRNPHE